MDSQTLSKVIRIVEKFNAAQQQIVTLIPFLVSMMSNNDRCLFVDEQVILATTVLMWCYSCGEFGHFCKGTE